MDKEYELLTNLVNDNLRKNDCKEIIFENYEIIDFNIYKFPISLLLKIDDNKQFIYEAYYKILDRIVDDESFNRLLNQLNNNKISKEKIIRNLFNSEERRAKQTNIIRDVLWKYILISQIMF